ncbi:hypothetical protein R4615_00130 [Acinetobacter baumannii]|nr:hypothetical protein [Acinetobacter baumannii]
MKPNIKIFTYRVNNKDNNEFTGILVLEITEKLNQFENSAFLKIKSYFYYKNDNHPIKDYFYTSYRFDLEDMMASISSENYHGKGDIIFSSHKNKEIRIGSLIMYIKILWLKYNYPSFAPIRGIHFKPAGSIERAQKFYENFGVPIDGKKFKCKDLILYKSWKKNIKRIKENDIDDNLLLILSKNQKLKKQIDEINIINKKAYDAYSKINFTNVWFPKNFLYKENNQNNISVNPSYLKLDIHEKCKLTSCVEYENIKLNLEKERLITLNKKLSDDWSNSQLFSRLKFALRLLYEKFLSLLIPILFAIFLVKSLANYFN